MQRRFYTKRALAFTGQNHHAASVQNAQQPSACFLRGFPEYHRELLPQDTLYHLVKVRIHGVDLSAAALLLGLLLPQLLEQGQVPAAGEPTISMTALLELLKDADPEMKAKLRLALLT